MLLLFFTVSEEESTEDQFNRRPSMPVRSNVLPLHNRRYVIDKKLHYFQYLVYIFHCS